MENKFSIPYKMQSNNLLLGDDKLKQIALNRFGNGNNMVNGGVNQTMDLGNTKSKEEFFKDVSLVQQQEGLSDADAIQKVKDYYKFKGFNIGGVDIKEEVKRPMLGDIMIKGGHSFLNNVKQGVVDFGADVKSGFYNLGGDINKISEGRLAETKGLLGYALKAGEEGIEKMKRLEEAGDRVGVNGLEKFLGKSLTIFGVGYDIGEEAFMSALKTFAPEKLEDLTVDGINKFVESDGGKAIIKFAQKGGEKWNEFKESSPEAKYFGLSVEAMLPLAEVTTGYGIAKTGGSAIVERTGKTFEEIVKEGKLLSKKAKDVAGEVKDIAVDTAEGLYETLPKPELPSFRGGDESKLDLDELLNRVGDLDRSDEKTKENFRKSLNSIDTTDVKDYQDLGDRMKARIGELAEKLDEILPDNKDYQIDDFTKVLQNGMEINAVKLALDDLSNLYIRTNDIEGLNWLDNFSSVGEDGVVRYSIKDINDLSRIYNQEFGKKAFTKTGDRKFSDIGTAYENIRVMLKEQARTLMDGELPRLLDKEMYHLYDGVKIAETLHTKAGRVKNKYTERGLGVELGRTIGEILDFASFGTAKGAMQKLFPSGAGYKTISYDEMEEKLKKRLELIDKLEKVESEDELRKILQKEFGTEHLDVVEGINKLDIDVKKITDEQANEVAETIVKKYDNPEMTLEVRGNITEKIKEYIKSFGKGIVNKLGELFDEIADILNVRMKFVSDNEGRKINMFQVGGKNVSKQEWIDAKTKEFGGVPVPKYVSNRGPNDSLIDGLKIYDYLEGQTMVSSQFISNLTNNPAFGAREKELIKDILDEFMLMNGDKKINVNDFMKRYDEINQKIIVNPLKETYFEDYGVEIGEKMNDFYDNGVKYREVVYEFEDLNPKDIIGSTPSGHYKEFPKYAGHSREREFSDGGEEYRIVGEKQSDLFQKKNIDIMGMGEADVQNNIKILEEKLKLPKSQLDEINKEYEVLKYDEDIKLIIDGIMPLKDADEIAKQKWADFTELENKKINLGKEIGKIETDLSRYTARLEDINKMTGKREVIKFERYIKNTQDLLKINETKKDNIEKDILEWEKDLKNKDLSEVERFDIKQNIVRAKDDIYNYKVAIENNKNTIEQYERSLAQANKQYEEYVNPDLAIERLEKDKIESENKLSVIQAEKEKFESENPDLIAKMNRFSDIRTKLWEIQDDMDRISRTDVNQESKEYKDLFNELKKLEEERDKIVEETKELSSEYNKITTLVDVNKRNVENKNTELNKLIEETKQRKDLDKLGKYNIQLLAKDGHSTLSKLAIKQAIEDGKDYLLFPTGKSVGFFESWPIYELRAGGMINNIEFDNLDIGDYVPGDLNDYLAISDGMVIERNQDTIEVIDMRDVNNYFDIDDAISEDANYRYEDYISELNDRDTQLEELGAQLDAVEKGELKLDEGELDDLRNQYNQISDEIEEIKDNYSDWDFDSMDYNGTNDDYYENYIQDTWDSTYMDINGRVYVGDFEIQTVYRDDIIGNENIDLDSWNFEDVFNKGTRGVDNTIIGTAKYYQYTLPNELSKIAKKMKIDLERGYKDKLGLEYYKLDLRKFKENQEK